MHRVNFKYYGRRLYCTTKCDFYPVPRRGMFIMKKAYFPWDITWHLPSSETLKKGHSICGYGRLRLKCDGTRAETRFRLSAKRTSPFKSVGAPVQSTTGSRGVRISCSNAGYTMFRGSVKSTGYPLHSPVSPSLPLPCVTVCHQISTGLYSFSLLPRLQG
jgi:hypothetical protein